jgi:hypothetical protein
MSATKNGALRRFLDGYEMPVVDGRETLRPKRVKPVPADAPKTMSATQLVPPTLEVNGVTVHNPGARAGYAAGRLMAAIADEWVPVRITIEFRRKVADRRRTRRSSKLDRP